MSSLLNNHIVESRSLLGRNSAYSLATWLLPHSLNQLSPKIRPQGPLQFRDSMQQSRKGLAQQSRSDRPAEGFGQRHVRECMIVRN